jgi:hypothetical protein
MAKIMSKTRMVFEIEADTWGPAQAAIRMIQSALQFPAITSVKCVKAETNYRLHQEPGEVFTPVEIEKCH